MTTFQDPPPQSRRAVRQSERGEGQAQTPVEGAPYAFDAAAPANQQAAPQQSAAEQPTPDVQQPPVAAPHTGRRAQQPPQDPAGAAPGEPLTYSTQGRVSPPVAEQSQQQPLAAAPPPGSPDQAAFRVRDFSPEGGRRAAPRDPLLDSPLSAAASFPAPATARPVELDYQTQGVPPTPSHSAASVPVEDTINHTLSRRELREMRAAAEQDAPPLQMPSASQPEAIDALLNSGPIEIPTLAPPPGQSQALAEAMAEFDMLTRTRREAEARARDAQVASLATPIIPTQQVPVAQVPVVQQPVVQPSAPQPPVVQQHPPVASAPVVSAPVAEPQQPQFFSAPQPSAPQPSAPQASVPQAPAPAPQLVFPPIVQQPVGVQTSAAEPPVLVAPVFIEPQLPIAQPVQTQESAPTQESEQSQETGEGQEQDPHGGRSPRASNHWRVQAAMEDDELPYENTLSRTVGSNTSAITTSALVLPSVPQPDSMLGSLTSTGEILVTGSINLPRSLGSTGAHPDRVDNSDYEEDPFDSQVAAPDSAPVRAIRAISSNTSTRGVIETKRPQGNRMLTAVIVVGSVLCVAILGVLIVALATGKL